MKIVDAHQHYWQPDRGDYDWLAHAPALLQRSFLPHDLLGQRHAAGVHFSVLIQAAPSEDETRYLFDLARTDPGVLGVVGWIDMAADDATVRIEKLARDGDGLLRGIRPMAQDIVDPNWLNNPLLDRAFDCLQAHGLTFDALVTIDQLPALHRRLQRQHELRAVLDHAAKPPIVDSENVRWIHWIDALAQLPGLHCKLSGLLTQLGEGQAETAIEPWVERLFASFGAARLMWGSDWPVLTTRSDYSHWLRLAMRLTAHFAPGTQAQLFASNAIDFYGLNTAPALSPSSENPA
ncbi:L-fuconolactonase [Rhodanobacter sp. ANJX3]|uniref:amidohydrolase family protein n=1 Tax=unclassified Rhodanobacter TaxID=2621553 RepID=UPI0015CE9F5E|nr:MULTISPECIES: amidohydrolase family protein [unclassified Rhodanobacter]MBB5358341.1 L-fuconolactonase [Rhodanobacter sp. ANJX3]NYE27822.1 L-fuconolactonase [Rhodanobacter sp. K2T2]